MLCDAADRLHRHVGRKEILYRHRRHEVVVGLRLDPVERRHFEQIVEEAVVNILHPVEAAFQIAIGQHGGAEQLDLELSIGIACMGSTRKHGCGDGGAGGKHKFLHVEFLPEGRVIPPLGNCPGIRANRSMQRTNHCRARSNDPSRRISGER